ncbi:Clavaminate synthase-like protein [Meredithblackwellia eburnea MCA 4105]
MTASKTTEHSSLPFKIPDYSSIPETTADLPWADLITLHLDEFDQPGGKEKLAAQLKKAINEIGFFYIDRFGISQEDVDAQFALGREIFQLPQETKNKFLWDHGGEGGPLGYKPKGIREVVPGVFDAVEFFDDPKYISQFEHLERPEPIERKKDAVAKFMKIMHEEVHRKLLVLCAIILECPDENELVKLHNWHAMSNTHMRYMLYHPRSKEELQKLGDNPSLNGHTDFGSLTLLFRQPVAALQVRKEDGESWIWVKPYPGSITVNVADTLQFLSGGYLKSSIHRVVTPPQDQVHIPRLGVIFFTRPDNTCPLTPVDSKLLEREGSHSDLGSLPNGADGRVATAGEWVRARSAGSYTYNSGLKGHVSKILNGYTQKEFK